MKIIGTAVLVALLCGCGTDNQFAIDTGDWSCTKVGRVESSTLTPIGKTAMLLPKSTIECVQWTRMSEQL